MHSPNVARTTNLVFNQKHADISRCVANERVNSTDRLDPGTTIIGDDAETDVVRRVDANVCMM